MVRNRINNQRNLVVHASDLPRGRGFSPLSWLVIDGVNEIPVCLIEAVDEVDAGPVVYREAINFEGHELLDEMRVVLGKMHIKKYSYRNLIPLIVPILLHPQ